MENNERAHRTVGAVQGYGEEENQHIRDRAGSFKHFFSKQGKKRTGLIPTIFNLDNKVGTIECLD